MDAHHSSSQPISGQRVTVAGLGHFGGGIAVSRWLVEQGARVLVTDKAPAAKLVEATDQLAGLPIEYRLGGHVEADFRDADLVVASPAIPPTNPYLAAARSAGVPVTTEICLFLGRCRVPVVGVTGTKGKSTTSAMLHQILQEHRRTWLGGNIGRSLLADLPRIQPTDVVLLELSSFMLHYTGEIGWSPHVAILTLLADDHLDWHGSSARYADAKRNIVRFQKPGDVAVVNEECASLLDWLSARPSNQPVIRYGVAERRPFELTVPGRHNQLAAQGAFAAGSVFGVDFEAAQTALRRFQPLPHRLALVHEADGVRWYDDSIATVPEAAVAALEAFEPGRVIQIVGGHDKGLEIRLMAERLAERAKAVLCIGQTAPAIAKAVEIAGGTSVRICETLDRAVAAARGIAASGDIVLLSTGYASYGQFSNFEERGDRFAELARSGL